MAFSQLNLRLIFLCAAASGWSVNVNAQTRSADDLSEVDLTASLPEAPEAVLEPAQEQEFQRKQKRRLVAGWTLVGVGIGAGVPLTMWAGNSGGDVSVGFKRGLAVGISALAVVVAGGGVLIKRRMKKNEHDAATQLRLTLMSISAVRRF